MVDHYVVKFVVSSGVAAHLVRIRCKSEATVRRATGFMTVCLLSISRNAREEADQPGYLHWTVSHKHNANCSFNEELNADLVSDLHTPPKVLITTSPKASKATYDLCGELVGVCPGAEYMWRKNGKGLEVGRIAGWAAGRGYTSGNCVKRLSECSPCCMGTCMH